MLILLQITCRFFWVAVIFKIVFFFVFEMMKQKSHVAEVKLLTCSWLCFKDDDDNYYDEDD